MIPTLQNSFKTHKFHTLKTTPLKTHSKSQYTNYRMIIELREYLKHSPEEDQFTHANMLDI